MCLTLENLSAYLGKDASVLLSVAPFTHWKFTKTLETDTPKPLIDYVFTEEGMDFVCDETGRICNIFLYADQARCFVEGIADLPFTSTRHEVIGRLGAPSKAAPASAIRFLAVTAPGIGLCVLDMSYTWSIGLIGIS